LLLLLQFHPSPLTGEGRVRVLLLFLLRLPLTLGGMVRRRRAMKRDR